MGDVQGAASSLAIVVTGLLTVLAAPLFAKIG
jgi:putative effector of murein hydrolase